VLFEPGIELVKIASEMLVKVCMFTQECYA